MTSGNNSFIPNFVYLFNQPRCADVLPRWVPMWLWIIQTHTIEASHKSANCWVGHCFHRSQIYRAVIQLPRGSDAHLLCATSCNNIFFGTISDLLKQLLALADDTVSLLPIRQSFEGILTKSNKFKPALIVALLLHHSSKNLEKCKWMRFF